MRILVCGGRDFKDREAVVKELDKIYIGEIDLIIDGAARGADTFAYEWAVQSGIPTKRFPADWETYGKAAGHIRNQQMLDEGKPDLVVAFPGGRGTANMIERARKAGVKVIEIE